MAACVMHFRLGGSVPFSQLLDRLLQRFRSCGQAAQDVIAVRRMLWSASLALDSNPNLLPPRDLEWVRSDAMRRLTTGATNDRKRVIGRVESSRDGTDPAF
jgi:hypothetical protein